LITSPSTSTGPALSANNNIDHVAANEGECTDLDLSMTKQDTPLPTGLATIQIPADMLNSLLEFIKDLRLNVSKLPSHAEVAERSEGTKDKFNYMEATVRVSTFSAIFVVSRRIGLCDLGVNT
jgi:hypothetical protein